MGTGYKEKHLITNAKYGVGSWMLWGCFVTGGSWARRWISLWILPSRIFQPKTCLPGGSDLPIDRKNSVFAKPNVCKSLDLNPSLWPELKSKVQMHKLVNNKEWTEVLLQVSPTFLDVTGRDSVLLFSPGQVLYKELHNRNIQINLYNVPVCLSSIYHLLHVVFFLNVNFCSFLWKVPDILEDSVYKVHIFTTSILQYLLFCPEN